MLKKIYEPLKKQIQIDIQNLKTAVFCQTISVYLHGDKISCLTNNCIIALQLQIITGSNQAQSNKKHSVVAVWTILTYQSLWQISKQLPQLTDSAHSNQNNHKHPNKLDAKNQQNASWLQSIIIT